MHESNSEIMRSRLKHHLFPENDSSLVPSFRGYFLVEDDSQHNGIPVMRSTARYAH